MVVDNLLCSNKQLEDLPQEKWADIIGYDGIYSASNFGRIKRENRHDTLGRLLKTKILTRTVCKFKGVVQNAKVTLCADNKKGTYSVSKLVYEAFFGEIQKGMCIMHADKDRTNDILENLKLVEYSESLKRDYEVKNKISKFGEWGNVGRNKGVHQINDKNEIINTFTSLGDVVKKTGYCKSSIADVCRGRYKKAYGYKWTYIEEKNTFTCSICLDTGFYTIGGSFGGSTQTHRCICKIHIKP